MSAPPLFAALLAAGPDALRCLFTEAQPTRAVLLANLAAGWPDADAGTHGAALDALLAAGHLLPSITARDRYRLALDVLDAADNRDETGIEPPTPAPTTGTEPERPAPPLFSYFTGPVTNTTPRAAITVGELHRVLTAPPHYLRERAHAARAEYEAHGKSIRYGELKTRLDYFSAGGIFTRRQDAALLVPSGLLTLDFDALGGRVAEARAQLLADAALAPALALVFVSPSGDGLKAVLAADPRHDRATNYQRLARHLTRRYGWGPTLDAKTADVSRACFLSYDPDAWLAPAYAGAG